jgi:hypothetical protein
MQSELPDTPERSTWSGPDREDGQQTDDTTTRSRSNRSGITSQTVIPEADRPGPETLPPASTYVTSVAGRPVNDEDAEQFIHDLEEWYVSQEQ